MSEKITLTTVLQNRYGLHARPAALFVQTCNRFASEVMVSCNGLEVSGKTILSIMTLGASAGTEIVLNIEGHDAEQAAQAIKDLISNNFGEK